MRRCRPIASWATILVALFSSPGAGSPQRSTRGIAKAAGGRTQPSAVSSELGIPPGTVLAWAERQSCDGTSPAVLLRWTPADNSLPTYTVERLDGGYSATVDSTQEGFAHMVTIGLEYAHSYEFRVVAHNNFGSTRSNVVPTFIMNEECLGAAAPGSAPGPFIAWMEPAFCDAGSVEVELHWSASGGAESYTLERFASAGGTGRVVTNLQQTTFLDSLDIAPGVTHAYYLTAQNASGTTGVQFTLPFHPRPDLCSDIGLPGDFQLTTAQPICLGGEPAIPISWTESSGADKVYRYRVLGQGGSDEGDPLNTNTTGFSTSVKKGVKLDQVHELFMVATDPVDPKNKRFSNRGFVAVSAALCGPLMIAPEVYTQPANGITGDAGILRSQVKSNGSPTFAYFEWGKTTPYTDLTSAVSIGSTPLFFQKPSRQITGLECETDYHYRVVAWNDAGTSIGADRIFTTESCPPCGQADLVLTDLVVTTAQPYEACRSISVGPSVSVDPGGALGLTAPTVVFNDGFAVKSGGSVNAGPPQ